MKFCSKILLKKYNARLFNTGGDSFFAEFESAVTAVDCAVEFQNAIKRKIQHQKQPLN